MTERRAIPLPVRLTLIYALLVGATLLIVGALVIQLTRAHLSRSLDRRLAAAVSSFEEGPARRVSEPADLSRQASRWLSLHGFTGDEVAAIRTSEGEVLTAAGGLDLADVEGGFDLLVSTESRWWDLEGDRGRVRALTVPLLLGGRQMGTLVVAATRTGIDETLGALLSGVGWASGVGLVLAAVLGYLTVRRTLRPLTRMASEVEAIEATRDLSRRVGVAGPPDEVGRLARAFDRMLGRLEEVFRSQQRFLSDASHELRTPLTVMKGQLELLGEEIDSAQGRRSLGVASDELERMRRIVDDLLLLARLDEGLALAREPVEVELVVREALLRGMPPGRGMPAEVAVEPDLHALADPERLLQVLTNLVANAAQHAGEGATLSVRGQPEGARVAIEVSDTGAGIPPEDLPHVFERLYRGAGSRARPGSGLGLAIAASLVRAMGGEIGVRSAPGEGSTFRVVLPGASVPRAASVPAGLE